MRVAGKELVRKAVQGASESSRGGFQQKIGTGDLPNDDNMAKKYVASQMSV